MATRFIARLLRPFILTLDFLAPVGDLLARLWVAYIFFISGLAKIEHWDSTLLLFEHEYHVPLLSPSVAAILGTGAELILPILLVLGLGGRLVIFIFFIYNLIAMISYPFLWTPSGQAGLFDHISWGLLLMLLMFHGPGKLSLDYLIRKTWGHLLIKGKK
jgi:putative oxidoreductase